MQRMEAPARDENRELLFLIADYLAQATPCQEAAQALQRELEDKELLGPVFHWSGESRSATYEEVKRRNQRLPQEQLRRLLERAVSIPDAEEVAPPAGDGAKKPGAPVGNDGLKGIHVNSVLRPVTSVRATRADALSNRAQLLEAFSGLSEVIKQIKVLEAAIERAGAASGETGLANGEQGVKGGQEVVVIADSPTSSAAGSGANAFAEANGHKGDEGKQDHEDKDAEEMGEASRERMKKDLAERKASLETAIKCLTALLKDMGDLRSRDTVYGGSWVPDRLYRRQLAGGRREAEALRRLSYGRYKHLHTVSGHYTYPVYCIKWDQRDEYMITGADDQLVKIWCKRSGRLMKTLRGHMGVITDVAVSSDNSLVATSSEDKYVRIWSLQDGACVAVLQGHTEMIHYVAWHPTLNLLFSASDDGTSRCWDLTNILSDAALQGGALSLQGRVVEHTRRARNGQGAVLAERRKVPVKSVSICPLGGYFVTGADDGVARVWSIAALEAPYLPAEDKPGEKDEGEASKAPSEEKKDEGDDSDEEYKDEGLDLYSSDDDMDGSFDEPEHVEAAVVQAPPQLPDVPQLVCELAGHRTSITDVTYSPLGDRFITASQIDGSVRVWTWSEGYTDPRCVVLQVYPSLKDDNADQQDDDEDNGKRKSKKKKVPSPHVDAAIWTHDGRYVVTSQSIRPTDNDDEGIDCKPSVKVWDSYTGAMLHELRGHTRITPILSAHPTDRRLAMSAARDGRVCLWDIERGKLLNSFTNILETTAPCQDHVMGNPVDFADGHFSPSHGWGIALADACGRVVLLGVDSEERYVNVEKEQYWQNDYMGLQWDNHGHAVDMNHQVAPHLVPRQVLATAAAVVYDPQPVYDITMPRAFSEAEMKLRLAQMLEMAELVARRRQEEAEERQRKAGKENGEGHVKWGAREVVTIHDEPTNKKRKRAGSERQRVPNETDYYDDFEYGEEGDEEEEEGEVVIRRGTRRRPMPQQGGAETRNARENFREEREARRGNLARGREQRARRRAQIRAGDDVSSDDSDYEVGHRVGRRNNRTRYQDSTDDEEGYSSGGLGIDDDDEEYNLHTNLRRSSRPARPRRVRRPTASSTTNTGGGGGTSSARYPSGGLRLPHPDYPNQPDDWDPEITAVVMPPRQTVQGVPVPPLPDPSTVSNPAAAMMPAFIASPVQPPPDRPREVDRATLRCEFCNKPHSEEMPLPSPQLGPHPLIMRDPKHRNREKRVWVHYECARWSPQVFTNDEGEWCNIAVEIRRGRGIKCEICNYKGATIGCRLGSCKSSFHYQCALQTNWTFEEDVIYTCTRHRRTPAQAQSQATTAAPRRTDNSRAKRQRREEHDEEDEYEASAAQERPRPSGPQQRHEELEYFTIEVGTVLDKAWLRDVRQEQDLGRLAPQLGDRVVYLPHAHTFFIRDFDSLLYPQPSDEAKEGGEDTTTPAEDGKEEVQEEEGKPEEEAAGDKMDVVLEEPEAQQEGPTPPEPPPPTAEGGEASGMEIAQEASAAAPPGDAQVEEIEQKEEAATQAQAPTATPTVSAAAPPVHGPWEAFPQPWAAVLCVVKDLRYTMPESEAVLQACESIACHVTLEIVGVPEQDPTQTPKTFRPLKPKELRAPWTVLEATTRECQHSDFLVLEGAYVGAMDQDLQVGQEVKTPFHDPDTNTDGFLPGTIRAIEALEASWPASPLRTLQVEWDTSNTTITRPPHMSPWEVVPSTWAPPSGSSILPLWPVPSPSADELAVAREHMQKLTSDPNMDLFSVPVDPDEYPTYETDIALPMDLSLITSRLENGYYRHIETLSLDLRLIVSNCRQFNEPTTAICKVVKKVQRAASEVLRKVKLLKERFEAIPEDGYVEPEGGGKAPRVQEQDEEHEVEEEDGDDEFIYYGDDTDDDMWDEDDAPPSRRSKRERGRDRRQERPRESARPQRTAKLQASQGMRRTAALLRQSDNAPFRGDDDDGWDGTPSRRSTRHAGKRARSWAEEPQVLSSSERYQRPRARHASQSAKSRRPGLRNSFALEGQAGGTDDEEEEAAYDEEEDEEEDYEGEEEEEEEEEEEHDLVDPSELQAQEAHVQQGDAGEGAGQEGEAEGPGPLPPPETGEAAEQQAFHGAGAPPGSEAVTEAPAVEEPRRLKVRLPRRPPPPPEPEPRRNLRVRAARPTYKAQNSDSDEDDYDEPPTDVRHVACEELVAGMLREDGYSLTTAQGGREVRGPSIEGIQQKIRDHRYTTFRDCENELRTVVANLPRRFPMEVLYETESKRLLKRLPKLAVDAVHKALAAQKPGRSGRGGAEGHEAAVQAGRTDLYIRE